MVIFSNWNYFPINSDSIANFSDSSPSVVTDMGDKRINFMVIQAPNIITKTRPIMSSTPTLNVTLLHSPLPTTEEVNTRVTPAKTVTKFPLLHALGINPNFDTTENEGKVKKLLAELVSLHRDHNKSMEFTYTGNGKPGFVMPIPRAKNYQTYEKNERTNKWLDSILVYLSKHSDGHSKVDEVCSWLLRDMYKNYPKTFIDTALHLGLHISQKMNHIEAAAMWMDANVSYSQAKIILRHLYSKFGHRVQVPLNQVKSLGDIPLEPVFHEFFYRKDKDIKDKVSEKIKYWCYDTQHLLELDMSRFLMSYPPGAKPIFGYDSKGISSGFGVYCTIGSDHGAGKSRYMLRLNYENSSSRRKNDNKVDFGTRTLQFAEAICKRDVLELQQRIAPVVNKAKEVLETSKLIAVRYNNEKICCKFIPKDATYVRTQTNNNQVIKLIYFCKGEEHEEEIGVRLNDCESECWEVIPNIKVIVAGDLCFFATCTGRDGRSHCRCTYCDSSPSLWNQETPSSYNTLTKEMLIKYGTHYQCSVAKKKLIPKV